MSFRTKKGAKISFVIFATLTTLSLIKFMIIGLNEATLMFWTFSFVYMVNALTCVKFSERIEELEKK